MTQSESESFRFLFHVCVIVYAYLFDLLFPCVPQFRYLFFYSLFFIVIVFSNFLFFIWGSRKCGSDSASVGRRKLVGWWSSASQPRTGKANCCLP